MDTISNIDSIWEALHGLTLMTHERHGGHVRTLDDCNLVWCVRGKSAMKMVEEIKHGYK